MRKPRGSKNAIMFVIGKISPRSAQLLESLPSYNHEIQSLRARMEKTEKSVTQLREQVETLNRDLDESRRLNLRAAELMDIAFVQLSS